MQDHASYCPNLNEFYTQYSAGYLQLLGKTYYMPAGGYVEDTEALGTTDAVTVQCCLLDGCLGNQTCQTPLGPEPCLCASSYKLSVKVNACGSTLESLCN